MNTAAQLPTASIKQQKKLMKETILVAVNKEGTLKIATLKTICNLHKNFVGLRGLDSYKQC